MRIDIKPGYRPGDKVRFRDAGDESEERRPPDVVFVISQLSHARFTRDGDDLHVVVSLELAEALTGANVNVEGIDGKAVKMTLDHVVKPGSTQVVTGAGLTRRGAPGERGDLVVKFAVVFPERLLPSEKGMLKDVFARISAKGDVSVDAPLGVAVHEPLREQGGGWGGAGREDRVGEERWGGADDVRGWGSEADAAGFQAHRQPEYRAGHGGRAVCVRDAEPETEEQGTVCDVLPVSGRCGVGGVWIFVGGAASLNVPRSPRWAYCTD